MLCIFLSLLTKLQLMSDKQKDRPLERWTGLTAHRLASYYATLLFPYAITCKQWSALCIQNQSLALQLSFKQGPMPGAGAGGGGAGLLLEASKARITYWINNLHHLYKRRERERKCFLHHNYCSKQFWKRNGLSLGLTKFWRLLYFMQNVHI